MNAKQILGIAAALICAWLFAGRALAEDMYRRQTIKNGSNSNANDLHIVFDYNVWGSTVRPKDQPPGHDGDGAGSGEFGMCGHTWDFASPNTFGTVGPGGVAYLDYQHSCPLGEVNIDASQSYFTLDGNALPGFTKQGWPMIISRDAFYQPTSVTVQNNSPVPVTYDNVQFIQDNSLVNWNIDHYFLPTGTAVPGTPLTFTLNPGEQMVLPIGPTTNYTYVLVMMESRPAGDPLAEPAMDFLGARSGPASAKLSYDCVTGQLLMDTRANMLNGFIIHSENGDFTGLAVLPPGFLFNTNTPETIASQFGSVLTGLHHFGSEAVNRGMLWNPVEGRWDADDWTFTYTVDGVASTFYGDIELTGDLPGDTDHDGDVDAWDIQHILAANSYLHSGEWGWEQGDFNGDRLVNWMDIQMILDHGQYDSQQQGLLMAMVPEPAALSLMVAGAVGLLRRRRRK
jgi:hypothetical protein